MVESSQASSVPAGNMYDRFIKITVCNKEYGKRKKQVFTREKVNGKWTRIPKVDEQGKLVFENVDKDLKGTYNDLKQFQEILGNFQFKEEHCKTFELTETTVDELNEITEKVAKLVKQNVDNNLKTFVSFFYAGHGAMNNNHQILVLNGEEKSVKDFKTKQTKTDWVFAYDIEARFKNKFTNFGKNCFIWAVYACCRTILGNNAGLLQEQIEEMQETFAEEQQKEQEEADKRQYRGDDKKGYELPSLNHLFIYGCSANSLVSDDNKLIQNIATEFRLQQKNKSLCFPHCLIELSRRFRNCVVTCAASTDVYTPYEDKILAKLGIVPDNLDIILKALQKLIITTPNDFKITDPIKVIDLLFDKKFYEDGWYTGTTKSGYPHGFGAVIFKNCNDYSHKFDGFIVAQEKCQQLFYQGNFFQGRLHGQGLLILRKVQYNDRYILLEGEFQNNKFHGNGYRIDYDGGKADFIQVGDFEHFVPHGKNTCRSDDGAMIHGKYQSGSTVGASLRITPGKSTYFGQFRGDKYEGLGIRRNLRDESIYCGQFKKISQVGYKQGLGKMNYKDKSTYVGQFVGDDQAGFGKYYYPDGTCYTGFFYQNNKHGIGVQTDSKNKDTKVFVLNDFDGDEEKVLTNDQVEDINNGKFVSEMEVFFEEYYNQMYHKCGTPSEIFGYKDAKDLNFNFIQNESDKMVALVDDLQSIAQKNNLHKHELDEEVKQKMNEHWAQSDKKFKQIMEIYKQTDEQFESDLKSKQSIFKADQVKVYTDNRTSLYKRR